MSDGALSQDELEALLAGGNTATVVDNEAPGFDSSKERQIISFFDGLNPEYSESLTEVMNLKISMSQADCAEVDKKGLISELADNVVAIQNDYKGDIKGAHLYIVSRDDALKIAVPMMGQDKLEINGASVAAVSEAVSLISGITARAIGERIQTIVMTEDAEGNDFLKKNLKLPGEQFVRIRHRVQMGEESVELDEIFALPLMEELVKRFDAEPDGVPNIETAKPSADDFKINVDDLLGGDAAEPLVPGLGISGPIGSKPNVQNVQMQNLSPVTPQGEPRNISMLMDVSMEMTVELGRTRWNIRDILNIGEGTIIELEKLAGEPVDILVNGNFIARGEVVVIDENFGVRVTEILPSAKSVSST